MRISDWSSDVCSSDLLGDTQSGTIGDRQRRLVLEAAGRIEQPLHLGHGQYDGDLANLPGADQLAREVGAVERMREQEPQRRDDAGPGRRRYARPVLLELERPEIGRAASRERGGQDV